jgi:hypothetical protein
MPFERDPLSADYDAWSRRMLERAADNPYAWRPGKVTSPRRDPVDDKGLSRHERAAQRSLYYVLTLASTPDGRAAPRHAARGPAEGRLWSLQVDWGEPEYGRRLVGRGDRTRFCWVRVTPYVLARRLAVGRRDSYITHPKLRSRGELPDDAWQPRQGDQE